MSYETTIEVRFCDLDGLGHINNAHYLSYIELARTRFYEALGLGEPFQNGDPIALILARSEIDYLKQAKLTDRLRCEVWLEKIGNKSFVQGYELTHRSDPREVYAQAKAVLVWFDYKKNSSCPIPKAVRAKLEPHLRS